MKKNKKYDKPCLKVHGKFEELTKGGPLGSISDSFDGTKP